MKPANSMITKKYNKGCEWCNATGYTQMYSSPFNEPVGTTALTNVCPVCKGGGVIEVIETEE